MKIFSHENFCKWNFISALSLNPMPSEGNRVVITSHRSHCLMFGCTAFQMFYSVVNVTKKFSIHFWILVNSSNTSCSNKPWQQRWQITMTFQKRGRDIGGRNTQKKNRSTKESLVMKNVLVWSIVFKSLHLYCSVLFMRFWLNVICSQRRKFPHKLQPISIRIFLKSK